MSIGMEESIPDEWKNYVTIITDGDDCTWVTNDDGTFRCLDAEIRSMSYDQIKSEFGIKEVG